MTASESAHRPIGALIGRIRDGAGALVERTRSGNLGALPVILGLAVI